MTKVAPGGKPDALRAWREKHFNELENSLQAAIALRDDPETRPKEKVEAIKVIGRLLDAMSPERVSSSKTVADALKSSSTKKPELPNQLKEQLTRLIQNGTTRP